MQIRQKRLQFYPGRLRRFLTLFCVTISDAETPPPPPGVSISGSRGNSVQCHEKILTSSSPSLTMLVTAVWRTDVPIPADHIRNIFSQESLVKNKRPWRFSITN